MLEAIERIDYHLSDAAVVMSENRQWSDQFSRVSNAPGWALHLVDTMEAAIRTTRNTFFAKTYYLSASYFDSCLDIFYSACISDSEGQIWSSFYGRSFF